MSVYEETFVLLKREKSELDAVALTLSEAVWPVSPCLSRSFALEGVRLCECASCVSIRPHKKEIVAIKSEDEAPRREAGPAEAL